MNRKIHKKLFSVTVTVAVVITIIYILLYTKVNPNRSFTSLTPKKINDRTCFMFNRYVPDSSSYHLLDNTDNLPDLPKTMTIQDEKTYNQLLRYKRDDCVTPLPPVNFKDNTVLGSFVKGNCGVSFKQKVVRDNTTQKVTYTVEKKQNVSHCSGAGKQSMNLVVVKKIPDTYTVEFIVK